MREVISDIETTGFFPADGHRIIEIALVEMIDGIITGNNFHTYLNPTIIMVQAAIDIHGITNEFLENQPLFSDIVQPLMEFMRDDALVVHNAEFDIGFYNYELALLGFAKLNKTRKIIDTLAFARHIFPGKRAALESLCNRLCIPISNRNQKGAYLDAILVAEVYEVIRGYSSFEEI